MVASAQAAVDAGTRAAILEEARAPAAAAIGKPVKFKVEHLGLSGDWAFLRAEMQDAGGAPVDYRGTPMAEDAAHGAVSKTYVALLRRRGGAWSVVDKAVGPTDVAWEDWATRHGAPPTIFG